MSQNPQFIDTNKLETTLKNEEVLVSVIVPVYNVQEYLTQCLESIVSQSYGNLDIVLIDDGSTDSSGLICDSYAKNNKIRVFHTENNGLSSARNYGINNAKGQFITFIDSDDWVESNLVELLLRAAISNNAEVVSAQIYKDYIGNTTYLMTKTETEKNFCGHEILNAYEKGLFPDFAWNKLYRSDIFNQIRFPEGRNHEDCAVTWKIIIKLVEEEKQLTVIPEYLYHYRMRKNGISHTFSFKNIEDYWIACTEKLNGLPILHKELLSECMMIIGRMWMNYNNFSKKDKKKALPVIKEMQEFSITHYDEIMFGNYPRTVKLTCKISKHKSWFVMVLCQIIGKIRLVRKSDRTNLYN
ncbi:MAG: glycosyltransferase family 2 protein [Faecalicoccus sp.]|nr:glycosyltransferase family 2 protein [Faecalicoccus sp.]